MVAEAASMRQMLAAANGKSERLAGEVKAEQRRRGKAEEETARVQHELGRRSAAMRGDMVAATHQAEQARAELARTQWAFGKALEGHEQTQASLEAATKRLAHAEQSIDAAKAEAAALQQGLKTVEGAKVSARVRRADALPLRELVRSVLSRGWRGHPTERV
eukprot:4234333-Prymnesium_polylepis.1